MLVIYGNTPGPQTKDGPPKSKIRCLLGENQLSGMEIERRKKIMRKPKSMLTIASFAYEQPVQYHPFLSQKQGLIPRI